jgi:hypothetical protein
MDNLRSILERARTFIEFNEGSSSHDLEFQYQASAPEFYPLHSLPLDNKASAREVAKAAKKRTWKKPKDKPKRPLSAYNFFFQQERKEIIARLPGDKTIENDGLTEEQRRSRHRKTHGKIGFADLARTIADKWKSLGVSEKEIFESRANAEKERYQSELNAWKKTQVDSIKTSKPTKKKTKPSPPNSEWRLATVTPESFRDIALEEDSQPEGLSTMFVSSFEANHAQLVKLMLYNQSLTEFQQQDQDVVRLRDFLASSQILQYQSQIQPSTQWSNSAEPMNYLHSLSDTCQLPCNASLDYRRCFPHSHAFSSNLDEAMFEHRIDTTSPATLSRSESESSLEKSLDAFIDNFESDIQ